jgi:hypothetical protein
MTRDASLDEFLDESDDERDDEEPDAGEPDATDGPPTPADVEPARSTYTWSPGGAECAACGATVTERWRDNGQQVCADCKDWAGTPD